MHTECPGMQPTYSIQYGMHACTHKQQFSWSGDQSSTCRYTQCIMQAWHRPRMSIYAILIYRLRYVIGCMLYTNSCPFEILQKVCVQLKISGLSNRNVSSLLALSLWAVRRWSRVLLCREDILRFLLPVHCFLGEDNLGNTWPRHLKHGVQQQCLQQKCQEKEYKHINKYYLCRGSQLCWTDTNSKSWATTTVN